MSWGKREDSEDSRSVWFWSRYEGSKKVRIGQEIEAKIVYWNLKYQWSVLFHCKGHVMAVGVILMKNIEVREVQKWWEYVEISSPL